MNNLTIMDKENIVNFNCGEFTIIKPVEFYGFKKEAGLNSFTMSLTKWI